MNLMYIRKTQRSFEDIVGDIEKKLKDSDFNIVSNRKSDKSIVLQFEVPTSYYDKMKDISLVLYSMIPTTIIVEYQKNKEGKEDLVVAGGSFDILKSIVGSLDQIGLDKLESTIKNLVNDIAGVGELKVEKVKLFSTKSCPYCTMEKNWLEEKKVPFALTYVDEDEKAAEYMVQATGQGGVPVTEFIFEDGSSEFVVGFDRSKIEDMVKPLMNSGKPKLLIP